MQKKSLTVNYLYNVAYKVLALITPFITTPYISRVLGVDNVGIYNYTFSVMNYFFLFGGLGLHLYGQREISYQYDDPEARDRVFWEIAWLRMTTVAIASVAYFAYSMFSEYRIFYLAFGIELLASGLDISCYYFGTEDFKLITIRNFVVKLASIVCIFLFVKSRDDLLIYILCHTVGLFLGNVSLWVNIRKRVKHFYLPSKKIFRHLAPVLIFFLPQCLDSVYMLMDKVMIGNLSTMAQVGIYGQADKMIKMLVALITALSVVASPRIAQCHKEGNLNGIRTLMRQSFGFVFSLGVPLIFGIASVSTIFSNWFFGDGFEGVDRTMTLLSPVVIFMGMNSVMGWQYLMTVGKERQFIISVATGAVVNFALNFLLIPNFGADGAVAASILCLFVMSAINFYSIRDIIRVPTVLKMIPKPLISGVVMYAVVRLAIPYLGTSLPALAAEIALGGTVYLLTILITKDEFALPFFRGLLKKVKH